MRPDRLAVLGLLLASLAAAACRDRAGRAGGVRVPTDDERVGQGRADLSDPAVVELARTSRAPGRIIYDPPPDLSLASAALRRPELLRSFRPDLDTSGRGGRASPPRDTTGGDAAMRRSRRPARDTSGAARP